MANVKKTVILFQIALCIFFSFSAYSQDIPKELKTNPLYSHQKDIINGIKWVYEMKYRGSSLLSDKYWPTAEVRYNGEDFHGVRLNYDLFTDNFIVFVPEKGSEKFVVPRKDYLEKFSYTDSLTGVNREFEYFQLPGTREKKLYEMAYRGNSMLYLVRHEVTTRSKIENGFLGDYIRWVDLYLKIGDTFGSFKNRRTLLKLLGDHLPELRKFIRKNKLKINKHNYDDVTPVLKYYEQLNGKTSTSTESGG